MDCTVNPLNHITMLKRYLFPLFLLLAAAAYGEEKVVIYTVIGGNVNTVEAQINRLLVLGWTVKSVAVSESSTAAGSVRANTFVFVIERKS